MEVVEAKENCAYEIQPNIEKSLVSRF